MCCIFHDLSYNASEVTVVECCQIPSLSLSLSLSLSHTHTHTHTHTKIETSSREFLDVLFFECDDICLHWKLDTGFFSLETVSETHFPHWFFSIWHAYEQLTYLMFGRLMKNSWYEVPLSIYFKYLMLGKHPLSSPLIFALILLGKP